MCRWSLLLSYSKIYIIKCLLVSLFGSLGRTLVIYQLSPTDYWLNYCCFSFLYVTWIIMSFSGNYQMAQRKMLICRSVIVFHILICMPKKLNLIFWMNKLQYSSSLVFLTSREFTFGFSLSFREIMQVVPTLCSSVPSEIVFNLHRHDGESSTTPSTV